jgi:hypothetical protein
VTVGGRCESAARSSLRFIALLLSTSKRPRIGLELMRVLYARAPPSKPNGEPAPSRDRAPHYGFDRVAFPRVLPNRIEAAISVAPKRKDTKMSDEQNRQTPQAHRTLGASASQQLCDQDTFFERHRPIVNHIDSNASFDFGFGGCLFETFGEELVFVRLQDPACVWTVVDTDGVLTIESGFHCVNRVGYFVSETPMLPNIDSSFRFSE